MTQASATSPSRAGTDRASVADAIGRARRHSGRVRLLKLGLPLLAVLIVIAFLGRSWIASPSILGFELDSATIEDGRLVMLNPVIDGFTGEGEAYSMTARRALQQIGGDSQRVDLEGISARLPLDDGRMADFTAESGVLDRELNILTIDSEILVETDDGMSARLTSAVIDLDNGSIEADQAVDIKLGGTDITADSMSIRERGAVMIFDRRVRMNIDGQSLRAAREGQEQ